MGRRPLPRATAIPKIGGCQGNRRFTTIPIIRTQPCCGITTTLGITRLNVYAGLFGAFIIRDEFEDALNLPKGKYEIPLTLFDRSFDREGQLFYPVSPDAESPWVPEVFGDAILVNGKLFPYLEVEPRKYRFRVLNAANGRFFHLALSNGQEFHQIGTDLGFCLLLCL